MEAPPPYRLYVRAGRVLTCLPEQDPIEDAAILVQSGRIVAVGPAARLAPPPGVEVVDHSDKTVLPGLVDGHVHLMYRRNESIYDHAAAFDDHALLVRAAYHARKLLEAGVTTVRDCGSRGTFLRALRAGIAGGLVPGPRLLVCGPPVTTTRGHLWVCGAEADSAAEAVKVVRRLVKEEVDFVKIMATGGRMTPGSNVGRAQFSVDELRAMVDDAHRLGRLVAAHCLGVEGMRYAVEAGVDTIEHGNWLDESGDRHAFDEDLARRMAARGTYRNMATQPDRELAELPLNRALTEQQRRRLEAAQERWYWFRRGIELGVPSFFSTDAIYGQWDDACTDLPWLTVLIGERGGVGAYDALRMVTAVPAQAIGLGADVGTVAPGRRADLLVVRGDPLESLRALLEVEAVYQDGRRTFPAGG
ncbi:MAG TPA: amidohydrolase family protein [Chloroflexota bacterium]|nr:amidohydrolase family protein [Chloroflexota bacterium]